MKGSRARGRESGAARYNPASYARLVALKRPVRPDEPLPDEPEHQAEPVAGKPSMAVPDQGNAGRSAELEHEPGDDGSGDCHGP